jgi:hypothetical protein
MKFNNIKPHGLFYRKSQRGDMHVFYRLNDDYFEFAGDGSDDMSLFPITEEQYMAMKANEHIPH